MGGLAPGQLKSRRGWHSSPRRLHYRFSFFDRVSRTHCGKNSINFAGMAHSHRHRLAAAWPSLVRQIGPVLRRRRHFDAIERKGTMVRKLQIKGRCLQKNCKPGQRLSSIRTNHEWDAVLMVLLDHNFDATEIYEAPPAKIIAALMEPGSKARNVRGALTVNKFKSIGKLRWRRTNDSTSD